MPPKEEKKPADGEEGEKAPAAAAPPIPNDISVPEMYTQRLQKIYSRYKPALVPEVPTIMAKMPGGEHNYYVRMCNRYNQPIEFEYNGPKEENDQPNMFEESDEGKAKVVPVWLNPRKILKNKRRYLPASTGNVHGMLMQDYTTFSWPLPKMFGYEKYGYALIDIEDPAYAEECAGHSKRLVKLFYERQIVDEVWTNIFKHLSQSQYRRDSLPENATEKTVQKLEQDVKNYKTYLLELQQQRDLYDQEIQKIFSRCDQIKATIKKQQQLEKVRAEATKDVQAKIVAEQGGGEGGEAAYHSFCKTFFDVSPGEETA